MTSTTNASGTNMIGQKLSKHSKSDLTENDVNALLTKIETTLEQIDMLIPLDEEFKLIDNKKYLLTIIKRQN